MACLVKQGKKWYVKMPVTEWVDGVPVKKQKWVKGYTDRTMTQKLANRLENEQTAVLNGDIDPSNERKKQERSKPITAHIQEYRDHLTAAGRSGNHVAYTIGDIEMFVAHAGITNACQITVQNMNKFVLTRKLVEPGTTGDSNRTINRRVGSVQAFCKWLLRHGGITEYTLEQYPRLATKGHEKRHRRAMSAEEVELLLKSAPVERKFIYQFVLKTGLRYSEVASISPANFDFKNKTITIFANDAKNKSKHQIIPMHPDLIDPLKKMSDGIVDRIFRLPERTDAARTLRADCKAAGVSEKHIDFHALRHTFITLLAQGGVHPKVVQALARHSDIATTLNYYTHWKQDDERSALEKLTF